MNFFKTYIKEHYALFLIVLVLWLGTLFLGMYAAFSVKSQVALDITEYIESTLKGGKGFFSVFKNGIATNFKFTLLLCVSSSFLILLPLSFFLIGFKGFAAGFAASFIIRIYGFKGMAVTLTAVVLPLFFSMPVYFMMFISSLHFPISTFAQRKQILLGERWKMYVSFMTKMLILFLLLSIITVAESLLSPYFFSVLI